MKNSSPKENRTIPLVTEKHERYNSNAAETPTANECTYTQDQVALIASEAARAAVD